MTGEQEYNIFKYKLHLLLVILRVTGRRCRDSRWPCVRRLGACARNQQLEVKSGQAGSLCL